MSRQLRLQAGEKKNKDFYQYLYEFYTGPLLVSMLMLAAYDARLLRLDDHQKAFGVSDSLSRETRRRIY
jgi:hypothetical protein